MAAYGSAIAVTVADASSNSHARKAECFPPRLLSGTWKLVAAAGHSTPYRASIAGVPKTFALRFAFLGEAFLKNFDSSPEAKLLNLETILDVYRARRSGSSWKALCPVHPDRTPSLDIKLGHNGKPVIKCFAGCPTELVLAARGLRFVGADICRVQTERPKVGSLRPDPIAIYLYVDENGVLLYEVLRYPDKIFKQRRPDGNGGYVWNLDGVRRVPFHLPQLVAAPKDKRRHILDGEKDVLTAEGKGLCAKCCSGGMKNWPDEN